MTLRSPHEIHEADVNAIKELIAGSAPDDAAERERLLWQLVGIHAGALTPVSENEKRGMERVLAILERKLANLEASGARCLVACDAGCLMQMGGGLSRRGSAVKAIHLAQVLAGEIEG